METNLAHLLAERRRTEVLFADPAGTFGFVKLLVGFGGSGGRGGAVGRGWDRLFRHYKLVWFLPVYCV